MSCSCATLARVGASAIGFFGVLIACNPAGLSFGIPALMVLGAAFFWSVAMILMRPGEGHLEACPMPALNRQFTTYTLTPDRTAQKQAAE